MAGNPNISLKEFPAVIFLDINMPILDGFQFLEELEKYDADFVNNLKVVMLTSSINPEDEEKARKSRLVAEFLHKPLTEDSLKKLTKHLVA
jgi:CheY-like chemotaxis protein